MFFHLFLLVGLVIGGPLVPLIHMRLKAKVDANHLEIAQALRRLGCSVVSLAQIGRGVPDLLCGCYKKTLLLEIKDGNKPASQRKLTPQEEEFHASWRGGHCFVIHSVDEAVQLVQKLNRNL